MVKKKKSLGAYQIQHDKGKHHHPVWHCECTEVFPGWSGNWFLLGGNELPHLALKTLNLWNRSMEAPSSAKGFDGFKHICEKEKILEF